MAAGENGKADFLQKVLMFLLAVTFGMAGWYFREQHESDKEIIKELREVNQKADRALIWIELQSGGDPLGDR